MGRSFKSQMRSRRRLVSIWLLLLGLALYYRFYLSCKDSLEGCGIVIEAIAAFGQALTANLGTILITLFGLIAIYFSYRVGNYFLNRKDNLTPGFRNFPWQFSNKTISLYGKVEYVLKDRFTEKIKRKITDSYRTLTKNNDHSFRHIHQRFLITSPQLRPGEKLLVHHNVEFGKVNLRRGKWIHFQGVYAHSCGSRRTLFGRKNTFYGRVHYTHEPKGFIKLLSEKPKALKVRPIIVIDSAFKDKAQ